MKDDDDYEERHKMLKKGGYKEWKPTSKSDGNGTSNKWKIKFAIEPKTDSTEGNSSDSDTTSTDANEEEEEDDEV